MKSVRKNPQVTEAGAPQPGGAETPHDVTPTGREFDAESALSQRVASRGGHLCCGYSHPHDPDDADYIGAQAFHCVTAERPISRRR